MENVDYFSLVLGFSDVLEDVASLIQEIKNHAGKNGSPSKISSLIQDRNRVDASEWKELSLICPEEDIKYKVDENNKAEDDLFKRLGEHIHQLADHLPIYGCVVDVYLWPLKDKQDSKEGHVHYLGALRRLKDWHNAKFTVIEAEPSPDTEFLQRFLSADICLSTQHVVHEKETILWRGKVSICNKIENSGVTIPGVCMYMTEDSSPLKFPFNGSHGPERFQNLHVGHVGRMFEVLDEISLSSVISLMKTQFIYKICLYQRHPYSQVFLNFIQENNETGLLARLPIYPKDSETVTCSETNLSTSMWKENVMADVQFAQEPEEDLQDNYEFIYFIITSPDKNSSMTGNHVAVAYLLQHPYHLNGSLVKMIYHKSLILYNQEPDGEEFGFVGHSVMSADLLREVEKDLCILRQQLLQNWINEKQSRGETTEVPIDELQTKFQNLQLNYLNKLAEKLPHFQESLPRGKLDLQKNITEITENTYDWPERLILQYEESQKRSLSRIQSSESVAMSSPLQPCETASTTVDIKSFLKFFHPDGSASNDSLSPVRRRHPSRANSKLIQPDATSPHFISWPESKDTLSHDIYYNIDKKSEKMNNHMNKIREKYIKDEYYSSCLSSVVVFPKCNTKKKSPKERQQDLRRSPRKKQPPAFAKENLPAGHAQRKQRYPRLSDSFTSPLTTVPETSKRRLSTSHAPPTHSHMSQGSVNKESCKRRRSEVVEGRSAKDDQLLKQEDKLRNTSTDTVDGGKKESRSERHKRRLQEIVDSVLIENGVDRNDAIFKTSSARLFKVTKLFVMDLPNSRNLKDEMRKIAESQVQNVIAVDRSRLKSK